MFHHILIPLDGSPLAEEALPVAALFARTFNGSIFLLRVAGVDYAEGLDSLETDALIEAHLADDEAYLKQIAQHLDFCNLPVEIRATFGQDAETILETVEKEGCDAIVMSSHGRSGIQRWIMGSVAAKIARHAPVPVFLLHHEHPFPLNAQTVRVLVPLDGSSFAAEVIGPTVQLTMALSASKHGELRLLRVVKTLGQGPQGTSRERDEVQTAEHALVETAARIRAEKSTNLIENTQLTVTWTVMTDSDIVAGILRAAEQVGADNEEDISSSCDVIALATHGRSGIAHWTPGSIAERLIQTAKRPLLIVRPLGMSK